MRHCSSILCGQAPYKLDWQSFFCIRQLDGLYLWVSFDENFPSISLHFYPFQFTIFLFQLVITHTAFFVPLGFGVLLVLLPLNAIIWTIMEKFQGKQMELKDERVRVITEIIAGVKVLKLFSWENSFVNKIGKFKHE